MAQELIIPPDRQTALAEPAMAERLAKVEFDQQIATARSFPRSIEKAVAAIATLATLDVETAQECMYVLPRDKKKIEGPSARFAEIIASQWGNNRVAARVVHVDRNEGYIEAEGIFHDLETNSASTSRVRRRIVDSKGRLYSDDMIIVTGNAACSIARRNAILGGVPKPAWRRAYVQAQAVIRGDVKTVGKTRDELVAAFGALGVPAKAIAASLDLQNIADIKLDDIVALRGMYATLKSGEATAEEMFGEHLQTSTGKLQPVSTGPDIPDADDDAKASSEQKKTPAQDKQTPAPEQQSQPQQEPAAQKSTLLPKVEATQPQEADEDLFPGDRPSKSTPSSEGETLVVEIETAIRNCEDIDELEGLQKRFSQRIRQQPNNVAERCRKAISDAIFAAT